jgi:hypothetical protein
MTSFIDELHISDNDKIVDEYEAYDIVDNKIVGAVISSHSNDRENKDNLPSGNLVQDL